MPDRGLAKTCGETARWVFVARHSHDACKKCQARRLPKENRFFCLIGKKPPPWIVCAEFNRRQRACCHAMQCRHCGSMALCPMNTRELLARLITKTFRVSLQFCCAPGTDRPRAWDGVGIGALCVAMCEISQRHAAGPDLGCVTVYTNHVEKYCTEGEMYWLRRGGHRARAKSSQTAWDWGDH
jgi:hypothetical protein